MKAAEVSAGGVYAARVSGVMTAVRVLGFERRSSFGGPGRKWYRGVNLVTGREVTGTAARLRYPVKSAEEAVRLRLLTEAAARRAFPAADPGVAR